LEANVWAGSTTSELACITVPSAAAGTTIDRKRKNRAKINLLTLSADKTPGPFPTQAGIRNKMGK
jgi:hypothetical protein